MPAGPFRSILVWVLASLALWQLLTLPALSERLWFSAHRLSSWDGSLGNLRGWEVDPSGRIAMRTESVLSGDAAEAAGADCTTVIFFTPTCPACLGLATFMGGADLEPRRMEFEWAGRVTWITAPPLDREALAAFLAVSPKGTVKVIPRKHFEQLEVDYVPQFTLLRIADGEEVVPRRLARPVATLGLSEEELHGAVTACGS